MKTVAAEVLCMPSATSVPSVPDAISRVRLQILGLACSLSLLTYLDRICISRVQGEIQRDLSLSDIEMGFMFSAFTAGYALFEIPVGWLSDRWGARAVILRIVLWWSFFTALTGAIFNFFPESPLLLPLPWGWIGLSWGFVAMLVVRFLFGCGEAGVYPTLANVVRTWFPASQRAFAQGVIFMSARLGAALAPLIIGRLADAVGWRMAFLVLGLLGVAWSLVFARLFRNEPAEHPGVNSGELAMIGPPDRLRDHAGSRLPWREALASPAVWALTVVYVSIGCAWSFFPTWQPRYLLDAHGFSFRDSELWTGLPFLCGAAGSLIGGRLSDLIFRRTRNLRFARTVVGVGGCAGAAACMLCATLVDQPQQAVVLFALASFSNDLVLGPFWGTVTHIGGRYTGTLAGYLNMLGSLGAVCFVPLVPWLLQHGIQWHHVLELMSGLWVIAALAWLSVDTTRPLVPLESGLAGADVEES